MAFVRERKRIGDILLQQNAITEDQLNIALDKQKAMHQKLGTVLVELGFISERKMARVLQNQLGLDFVELNTKMISPEILNLVTDSLVLKKYVCMPFEFDQFDSKYLKVAFADPMDIFAIDDLSYITGMQITPAIATTADIMACIDKYYGNAETQAVADQY